MDPCFSNLCNIQCTHLYCSRFCGHPYLFSLLSALPLSFSATLLWAHSSLRDILSLFQYSTLFIHSSSQELLFSTTSFIIFSSAVALILSALISICPVASLLYLSPWQCSLFLCLFSLSSKGISNVSFFLTCCCFCPYIFIPSLNLFVPLVTTLLFDHKAMGLSTLISEQEAAANKDKCVEICVYLWCSYTYMEGYQRVL